MIGFSCVHVHIIYYVRGTDHCPSADSQQEIEACPTTIGTEFCQEKCITPQMNLR